MKIGKKNIPALSLLRLLSQILFFILLPGLYISVFSGIKQIYTSILHQSYQAAMLPQLIEAIAIIPVTILAGRFFCGWMCAFGALQDFLYFLPPKSIKRRLKINEKADRILKLGKYVLLAFLVIAVWSFGVAAFNSASPWDAFGMLFTVGKLPDFSFVVSNLLAGFLFFILVMAASFFSERFFCRYLCPLGAIFALASKLRFTSIKKSREGCGKCRCCTHSCPMGIALYLKDDVKSGECIECFRCITACPRKNATVAVTGKDVRPVIAGTAAVAAITGLYYAGSFASSALGYSQPAVQSDAALTANELYNDGTYTGEGSGFRGTTAVSVAIKSDKITDIKIVSYKDDAKFFNQAYPTIIQSVISKQSTNVSTVSGATYSSRGILSAVDNALDKAKIETADSTTTAITAATATSKSSSAATASATSATPSSSKTTFASTATTASFSSAKYKDGTYQGSGNGFRGTTTVSVTVQNGAISDIKILSYKDDARFFDNSYPTIVQSIISNQSANVNTVSGATYSSLGIISAVSNALSAAT